MADTTADTGQEPQANEDTASIQETQGGANEAPAGDESHEDSNDAPDASDELPEWARKQLKKANNEAASYRTQLREVQEKFKDAKTEAELEAILKPLSDKLDQSETRSRELERKLIIKDYGLDDSVAEFITGDDPDQWEAQAKKLAELSASGSSSTPDRQRQLRGRNGVEPNREFDPAERARRHFNAHRD